MSYTLYKTVNFGPGRASLATVGYTLTGGARITDGVAEVGTATGIYGAVVTLQDDFVGSILWDTGQGGSTVYAAEDIGITLSNGKTHQQAMEFIVAMVGGGKSSGALASGAQVFVRRNLADTADLASFTNDGVGNISDVNWP